MKKIFLYPVLALLFVLLPAARAADHRGSVHSGGVGVHHSAPRGLSRFHASGNSFRFTPHAFSGVSHASPFHPGSAGIHVDPSHSFASPGHLSPGAIGRGNLGIAHGNHFGGFSRGHDGYYYDNHGHRHFGYYGGYGYGPGIYFGGVPYYGGDYPYGYPYGDTYGDPSPDDTYAPPYPGPAYADPAPATTPAPDDSANAGSGPIVSAVQTALARQGYNPGNPDGILGPMTSNAISQYQSDHGMPATGQITPALTQALGLQ